MDQSTNKNPLVLFMPSGKRGRFAPGTPVLDAARELGVYVESVCGGRGICGRCQCEIQTGQFAKEFTLENQAGAPAMKAMRRLSQEHQIEQVGSRLREMMPWIREKQLVDKSRN